MNEQLHEPPKRDASVPRTPEERARHRALIWLIVKIVVVVVVVVIFISLIGSCFHALSQAEGTLDSSNPVVASRVSAENVPLVASASWG